MIQETRRHLASLSVFALFAFLAAGSLDAKPTGSSSSPGSPATPEKPQAEPTPAAPSRSPSLTVTATQLYNDYHANEVAADEKYKGKTLRVTGSVASIDKDFMGNILLRLVTPNEFSQVMATLQDTEKGKAGRLAKGNGVRLVCEGQGMVIGSPSLDDCAIE